MKTSRITILISAVIASLAVAAAVYAAPAAPLNLTATSISPTQINLSWGSSTDPTVTGYQVFRDGGQIATTSASSIGFSDSGLQPAHLYNYSVFTFDASSTVSSVAITSATTQADTTAPSKPTGLIATPMSPTQIKLAWASSTDNVAVTGYQIFQDGLPIATSSVINFSVSGLAASSTHNYAVTAFDAAGNISPQSDPASATTPATDTIAPSTPINLSATPISSSQINLSWTASTDNVAVAGYKVFRDSSLLVTTSGASYSNTGLAASTTYTYFVQAFDASGNVSSSSASTSATTLAAGTPPIATTTANIRIIGNEGNGRLINLRSNAKIKVLVYGGVNFKVGDIVKSSVTFGGAPAINNWRVWHNRDRYIDRIFEFRARDMKDLMGLSTTTATFVEVHFKASTTQGQLIDLTTTVRVKNLQKWHEDRDREHEREDARQALKQQREQLREATKKANERAREIRKAQQETIKQQQAQLRENIKQIKNEAKNNIKNIKQDLKELKNRSKDNKKGNGRGGNNND